MARRRERAFHAVLLAGGSGTRFWPLSRAARPKQFLSLAGTDSLLAATWKRIRSLAPASRIWVVAPAALAGDVRRELPQLGRDRLIVEPVPRDTAPAIALACARVAEADPDAVAGVFPTDHVVRDVRRFATAVRVAARSAAAGNLVCLGIRPDHPATGYGYLKCAAAPARGRAARVERFVEKPDLRRARTFVASGRYLWNAGMFVWTVERFFEELERTAPGVARAVRGHLAGGRTAWSRAPRLSVDYAVMEQARDVRVVPLDAGWDDVGSWDAAARLREAARGSHGGGHVLLDSPGSVIFGEERLVAIVGLPGIAVVDTPDALLVVPRDRAQEVKAVVDELRRRRRNDLL